MSRRPNRTEKLLNVASVKGDDLACPKIVRNDGECWEAADGGKYDYSGPITHPQRMREPIRLRERFHTSLQADSDLRSLVYRFRRNYKDLLSMRKSSRTSLSKNSDDVEEGL